jgi:hypothetical protein
MDTKLLIVLRAGRDSLHRSWTTVCAKLADVAISLYDDAPIAESDFVLVHRAPGGKYTGVKALFADHPWIMDAYTHFWLFEDDLYLPFESLLAVRDCIENFRFVLCGPSLAPESFAAWPIMIQNQAFHLRATNFVEIMAPIMSRDFLKRTLPMFGENRTGWGYEWLWQTMLAEMNRFAAILDCAPIVHTRPIGSGRLYDDPTGKQPTAFEEMMALVAKYGIDHERIAPASYFGLARTDRRLVYGAEFLDLAVEGYPLLLRQNRTDHERCRLSVVIAPPPLKSVEDILAFNGAAALLAATKQ